MSSTRIYRLDSDPSAIGIAAGIIRAGGTVAFPTETVYGLGANATDAAAVAKIYIAKQRALNDPLIVHCAPELDDLQNAPEVLMRTEVIGALSARQRQQALALTRIFWPGPLTLVLPRGARIPANVSAGLETVAVRMPNHPLALALIRQSGLPIAAPSANRFGHVSPTSAQHVLDDLDGRIDVLLDGGSTSIGVESTVLDLTAEQPVILRPGGLAREDIEQVIGALGERERGSAPEYRAQGAGEQESKGEVEQGNGGAIGERISGTPAPHLPDSTAPQRAPGMLSKHYAPRAELHIMPDLNALQQKRQALTTRGLRVGLLIRSSEAAACAGLDPQFILGETLADIARNLYAGLRALDDDGADAILISQVERTGLGEAIADRLQRGTAKN
ncbi:MAG TPA: L-threonylcarbamoyladenylate synthase [Anaerolineae bacterium]